MVDPVTITTLATSFITNFVSSLATGTGEGLFATVKEFLLKKAKPTENLEDLANDPHDEENQIALRKQLKKLAQEDTEFAELLQKLVDSSGVMMHQETETNTGTMKQSLAAERDSAKMTQKAKTNEGDMIQEA